MFELHDRSDSGQKPLNGAGQLLAAHASAVRLASAIAIAATVGGLCATLARSGPSWDQEAALYPWLMNHGWVLYRDIRDQHGPLFPGFLSLWPDPGSAGSQLFFMLILVVCTALLTAVTAWRVSGPVAAVIGVGLYTIWIVPFDGAHVWYDFGLAPFYLAALLLGWELLDRRASYRLAIGLGLLMGLACLVKQQAAIALFAGLALFTFRPPRQVALYLGAAAVPFAISVVVFSLAGALGDYLYWVVTYNLSPTYTQGRVDTHTSSRLALPARHLCAGGGAGCELGGLAKTLEHATRLPLLRGWAVDRRHCSGMASLRTFSPGRCFASAGTLRRYSYLESGGALSGIPYT